MAIHLLLAVLAATLGYVVAFALFYVHFTLRTVPWLSQVLSLQPPPFLDGDIAQEAAPAAAVLSQRLGFGGCAILVFFQATSNMPASLLVGVSGVLAALALGTVVLVDYHRPHVHISAVQFFGGAAGVFLFASSPELALPLVALVGVPTGWFIVELVLCLRKRRDMTPFDALTRVCAENARLRLAEHVWLAGLLAGGLLVAVMP